MDRLINGLVIAAALTLMTACAVNQWDRPAPPPAAAAPPPAQPPPPSKAAELVLYYKRINTLNPQELKQEYTALEKRAQAEDWEAQLRYALLLTRPETEFQDYGKAAALFDKFGKSSPGQEGELLAFSQLLHNLLQEQQKTAEANRALGRQLEDSKKQLEHVQNQINALKSIEKSIHERNTRERSGDR